MNTVLPHRSANIMTFDFLRRFFTDVPHPTSCADIQNNCVDKDGVYTIYIGGDTYPRRQVYCDLTTDGGGWTVRTT